VKDAHDGFEYLGGKSQRTNKSSFDKEKIKAIRKYTLSLYFQNMDVSNK
jgi:hypothetical protein